MTSLGFGTLATLLARLADRWGRRWVGGRRPLVTLVREPRLLHLESSGSHTELERPLVTLILDLYPLHCALFRVGTVRPF